MEKATNFYEKYRDMVRHANKYRTPKEIEYINYDELSDRQLAKLKKLEQKLEKKRLKKQKMIEKYFVYVYDGAEPRITIVEKTIIIVVGFGLKQAKKIARKLIKTGGKYAYRSTLKPYVDELKKIKKDPITYFTSPKNWIKLGFISSIDAIPGGRVIMFIIKSKDAFKKTKKLYSKGQQVYKKLESALSFIKRPITRSSKKFSPFGNNEFYL